MAFRDETEALRARVRSLENENEELRLDLKRERGELAPEIPVGDVAEGDDLASLVASREAEEQLRAKRAEREGARRRREKMETLAKRPPRVTATRSEAELEIHIAPKLLPDRMWEQAGVTGFISLNPGIFIVVGLVALFYAKFDLAFGTSIGLAIPLWLVTLMLGSLGVAAVTRPAWRLAFTADEHFAVYCGTAKEPTLLGRTEQLRADVPEPGPSLASAELSDGRHSVTIEKLSPADLETFRAALQSVRAKAFDDGPRQRSLADIVRARAGGALELEEVDEGSLAELLADD